MYSLAITFWELAARKLPFHDVKNRDLIPTLVRDGDRDDIPADCPQEFASIIKDCWQGKPENRPDVNEIVERLNKMIIKNEKNIEKPEEKKENEETIKKKPMKNDEKQVHSKEM